jgi:hypothetical protein
MSLQDIFPRPLFGLIDGEGNKITPPQDSPNRIGLLQLTGSSGITVTGNQSLGELQISMTGSPATISWSAVTSAGTRAMSGNSGYTVNVGANNTATLSLPSTASLGSQLTIMVVSGLVVIPSGGQSLYLGNTLAANQIDTRNTGGGSAAGSTIYLICAASNSTWMAISFNGLWETS